MMTSKSFTALIFLVTHTIVTCMEQNSFPVDSAGIQQKQYFIMISANQSNDNATDLKAFRTNKPIKLNIDLVNSETNTIVVTYQLPTDLLANLSFRNSFEGKTVTGIFTYVKNPRLNGTTLSEQLKEAQELAFADLCSKRLKQIKY